jgi:hypothetical protein
VPDAVVMVGNRLPVYEEQCMRRMGCPVLREVRSAGPQHTGSWAEIIGLIIAIVVRGRLHNAGTAAVRKEHLDSEMTFEWLGSWP